MTMVSTKTEYIHKDDILILNEQLHYELILFTEHTLYVNFVSERGLKNITTEICKEHTCRNYLRIDAICQ